MKNNPSKEPAHLRDPAPAEPVAPHTAPAAAGAGFVVSFASRGFWARWRRGAVGIVAGALLWFGALVVSLAQQSPAPTPADSNRASPTATGETSRAVLALNLQNNAREIAQAQEETKGIETLLTQVRATRDKLVAVDFGTEVPRAVTELQKAFEGLRETWRPGNGVAAGAAARRFLDAVNGLERAVDINFRPAVSELRSASAMTTFNPAAPVALSRLPAAAMAIVNRTLPPFARPQKLEGGLPALYRLYGAIAALPNAGAPLGQELLPGGPAALPVPEAEKEVAEALPRVAPEAADETRRTFLAALDTIDKELTGELKEVNTTLAAKVKQQNELDKKIKAGEDADVARQRGVSDELQPIFWGIMLSIVLTLVILRLKGDEQSELMIRERTAVEILSTGLFLVTVLFLGAGGFIEKTILGTLLGTLAGYLFTRRGGVANSQAGDNALAVAAAARPDAPSKPTVDAATRKFAVKTLPKGADYVAVFAQEVATGKTSFLGALLAGEEFDLSASSLAKGKPYAVWLIARNAGGESKPSASVLVTL